MKTHYKGFLYAISANIIWGLFPLYFHKLNNVSTSELIAQRIIWTFFLVLGIALFLKSRATLKQIFHARKLFLLFVLSAFLISIHWFSSTWAIVHDRVVDASLGYFLVPLISVLLGWIILHEKPNAFGLTAIILGILSVIWYLIEIRELPWVSLVIAFSFGFYGLVRKKIHVDSLTALVFETGILLPLGLSYWIWLELHNRSAMTFSDIPTSSLLILSGLVTAVPLFLFASATKRLTLTAVGFMLYIVPSMNFYIAIFVFHEPISITKLIAFAITWLAIFVYSIGVIRDNRKSKTISSIQSSKL